MTRNYDRTHDKENSYDYEPKLTVKTKAVASNDLRRKLNYSLGLIDRDEPNTI